MLPGWLAGWLAVVFARLHFASNGRLLHRKSNTATRGTVCTVACLFGFEESEWEPRTHHPESRTGDGAVAVAALGTAADIVLWHTQQALIIILVFRFFCKKQKKIKQNKKNATSVFFSTFCVVLLVVELLFLIPWEL